jgi:hypothetical protein
VEEEGISADVARVEIVGEVVKVAEVANATEVELLAEVLIVAIYRVQHPFPYHTVAVDCAHGVTMLSHGGQ